MEVNKKRIAEIFGVSIRTIQNWQDQGMPVARGGGKGNEVMYDSAAVIVWYSVRAAAIENEKLRKVVEDLCIASESDLQPGTIEYERHRLTRAQADAQELKNARETGEVIDTAFATYALSKLAAEIGSILDSLPLAINRKFPDMEPRYSNAIRVEVNRAVSRASAAGNLITEMAERYIEEMQKCI